MRTKYHLRKLNCVCMFFFVFFFFYVVFLATFQWTRRGLHLCLKIPFGRLTALKWIKVDEKNHERLQWAETNRKKQLEILIRTMSKQWKQNQQGLKTGLTQKDQINTWFFSVQDSVFYLDFNVKICLHLIHKSIYIIIFDNFTCAWMNF